MAKSSKARINQARTTKQDPQSAAKPMSQGSAHRYEVERLDDGSYVAHLIRNGGEDGFMGGRESAGHSSVHKVARHMKKFFGGGEDEDDVAGDKD